MTKNKNYVKVIFDLPVDREFHYRVPAALETAAEIGKRVKVPFGSKIIPGLIVGFSDKPAIPVARVKPVLEILDDEPLLNREILDLSRWLSRYYFCAWGQALFESVPAAVIKGKPGRIRRIKTASGTDSEETHLFLSPGPAPLKLIKDTLKKRRNEIILFSGYSGVETVLFSLGGIDFCLEAGKQIIILVPEISMTSPIFRVIAEKYSGQVGVLHSDLSRGEHYEQWQRIKKGEVKIIIGTRSAVFAPAVNPGMIMVIDEEDDSYKQQETPRYHAREVALYRARLNQALVILSSAAPSLETFHLADTKKIRMVAFPEKIDKPFYPEVEIVDMGHERFKGKIISPPLEEAIRERIEKKEKIILFLNRRGFATVLACRHCGFVMRCPDCNVPMVFHQTDKTARCHYCNYKKEVASVCPQCYSSYMRYFGLGTQKLEEIIKERFPGSGVLRLDSDSTRRRHDRIDILEKFKKGESVFLIATQMITKEEWNFPRLTLAGVISADSGFNLPDFRSGEKTFQMLMQILTRLRKSGDGKKIIVQTLNPEHPVFQSIKNHQLKIFYEHELKFRKELNYPPFSHFVSIIITGKDETKVEKTSRRLFLKLKERKSPEYIEILSPVTPAYSKIKGRHRKQIFLKTGRVEHLETLLHKAIGSFSAKADINITVDIDPVNVF